MHACATMQAVMPFMHVNICMAHLIIWNHPPHYNAGVTTYRPLGAHKIAGWLRQQGYSVKVIDFAGCMTTDQLVKITARHLDRETVAVGTSNTFWPNHDGNMQPGEASSEIPQWVVQARSEVSDRWPRLKWIMGGTRTIEYDLTGWIGFEGNAEDSLLSWLDSQAGTTRVRPQFDILHSCGPTFSDDDHISSSEVIPIELGRGCMFNCKFCGYTQIGKQPGTYLRDLQSLRAEILDIHQRWGVTRFYYLSLIHI